MVDGKPKATKFFQRPREQLSLREQPGLEGHVGSDELHEFLMPHLFGIGFPRKNLLPLPYTLDGNEKLVLALATGMRQIAVEKILDELKNGTLTLYASELTSNETWGTRHRVPASVFDNLTAFEIETEFLLGGAHGPVSAFPEWAWEKQFFFEVDDVEVWLESLEPVAMLPAVVERDGELLPSGQISASAAICWVAGQNIRDWYGLVETGGEIRDAINILESQADVASVAEYYSMARTLTVLVAERHVRSLAANEVIRLMGEGRLTGYGVPDHRNSNAAQSVFEEIPETAFLIQREFSSNGKFTDCLVAAATDDRTEDQQASNEADWTYIRFHKEDLTKIWGRNPEDGSNRSKMEMSSDRQMRKHADLPMRIPKMREAEAHVKMLADGWKPGDFAPKRDDFVHDLKERFKLSRDEARELWSRVPWKKVGRPQATKSRKKTGG